MIGKGFLNCAALYSKDAGKVFFFTFNKGCAMGVDVDLLNAASHSIHGVWSSVL